VTNWIVEFHDAFEPEFDDLDEDVQDAMLTAVLLLRSQGPRLGRSHADTLAGSKFVNMKELRFRVRQGVWRVAFAFDPRRRAILLVASDKGGLDQMRFYQGLLRTADRRFARYLDTLKGH